jgi:hypothetical protein
VTERKTGSSDLQASDGHLNYPTRTVARFSFDLVMSVAGSGDQFLGGRLLYVLRIGRQYSNGFGAF